MISDIKKRAKHRLKIVEGQMKGLEKMIDSEEYCIDILTQSLAIQRSMASLSKLILENHLRTHVPHMLASHEAGMQEKAIEELLHLYDLHSIKGK